MSMQLTHSGASELIKRSKALHESTVYKQQQQKQKQFNLKKYPACLILMIRKLMNREREYMLTAILAQNIEETPILRA